MGRWLANSRSFEVGDGADGADHNCSAGTIDNTDIDHTERVRRYFVIALGKAAPQMMAGAVAALSAENLSMEHGIVICASDSNTPAPANIVTQIGDHPIPGPASLAASDTLDDFIQQIEPGDIVIVLLSGGTTSLVAAPVAEFARSFSSPERAQAHLANVSETLLESGLAIHEMNAIRRRLLRWGAGRLAQALYARGAARIPVFCISDVIGDDPAVIGSGPCSPDPLDPASFLALIDAYDLRSRFERPVAEFFGVIGGGMVPEVAEFDHPAFAIVDYELVARNADALEELASAARRSGIEHVSVSDEQMCNEAAELGIMIAHRSAELAAKIPRGERLLYVIGGEPVVNLRAAYESAWDDDEHGSNDEPMRGGRMQLLALNAALMLEQVVNEGNREATRIAILAAGTDGRDGPTDATGAIVDFSVPTIARRGGRVPERDAMTGRSWFPLEASSALLKTGLTGTNVMDVVAILIDRTA